MPELPEVETVRRGLLPWMEGRRILAAEARRPDLRWPLPPRFAARLAGARVEGLGRRSKYLLAALSTGETLLVHLGMSGRLLVVPPGANDRPAPIGSYKQDQGNSETHDHVVLTLEGGARVVFNDPRRFGAMDLAPTGALGAHRLLAGLGPEPLSESFGPGHLAAAFAGRRAPLKALLLDQRVVAGLGNIYVCEALHRARLSPLRAAGGVTAREAARLAAAVVATLREAIAAGGSSLRDYLHADGTPGWFQHAFAVYGREGEPCLRPRCRGTVGRVVQAGRSSFLCPACQR